MKLFIFISLLTTACVSYGSQQELMNFHTGTYKMTEGNLNLCGQGSFWIFEETKYLMLDALHGFSIKESRTVEPSDIPGEEGCKYYGKNDVKTEIGKTELTMTSVLKCKDVIRYTLVKRANITNRKIVMQVKQIGEGATEYKCDWTRQ